MVALLSPRRLRTVIAAVCLAVLLSGCASYVQNQRAVDRALAAHRPKAALTALKPLQGGRNQALYELNRAMILRLQGRYQASIQAFSAVKPLLRYLEATSVSETAAALSVSENARSYTPPLFERLLAYVYQSLNYLQSGQHNAAAVEARQIDVLLRRLYPDNAVAPHGVGAFARYFAGMIFVSVGQYNDAMVAYKKAYRAYLKAGQRPPRGLKVGLCRMAQTLGLDNALAQYKTQFKLRHWPAVGDQSDTQKALLVVVFSSGLAPVKIARTIAFQDPHNGHVFNLSVPELQRAPAAAPSAVVRVNAQHGARTQPVYDIAQQAKAALADKQDRLLAARVSRNVVRAAAANQADKVSPLLGVLVSLGGLVLDRADTRTWRTLPDNIQVARLWLTPGRYTVDMRTSREHTRVADVQVQPGGVTFLAWHAIAP